MEQIRKKTPIETSKAFLLAEVKNLALLAIPKKHIIRIAMMQPKRVDEVKDRCAKLGADYGLDGDFVRSLYTVIIDEACRLEDIIIDE